MTPLTYGSLFSGIGGIDLGFDRAGLVCKWQVEINSYARKVLQKHWPEVQKHDDIRTFTNIPYVDIVAGGFPCQDISYAGKGAGLAGERSGLFYELIRVVREVGPRFIVLENVAALLTRGLDQVLGTLASIGYDAEWHCIPAAAVGAPHIRDRVFILAYASGERARHESGSFGGQERSNARTFQPKALRQRDRQIVPKGSSSVCCNVSDSRCKLRKSGTSERPDSDTQAKRVEAAGDDQRCSEASANANSEGLEKRQGQNAIGTGQDGRTEFSRSEWWAVEPNVGRVAHGISARVDRLRGLGNAVVPQVAEFIATQIISNNKDTKQ